MVNYYRRCISNLANLQAPLTDLLKDSIKNDKRKISWTHELRKAVQSCKNALSSVTITAFPSPGSVLKLSTDASDFTIGASLEQLDGDIWKPIGFFSRKLSGAEKNYSTYDRELLAIFAAVRYFVYMLECREFTIHTDHKPLIYAFSQKLDKASQRQLRQLDYISQFSARIVHVAGDDNVVPDALARINAICIPTPLDAETIEEAQLQDGNMKYLIRMDSSLNLQRLEMKPGVFIHCSVSDGVVRPYMLQSIRKHAFDSIHSLSHPSIRVTSKLLREEYVWPGIRHDAANWTRQCLSCRRSRYKIQSHTYGYHIHATGKRI